MCLLHFFIIIRTFILIKYNYKYTRIRFLLSQVTFIQVCLTGTTLFQLIKISSSIRIFKFLNIDKFFEFVTSLMEWLLFQNKIRELSNFEYKMNARISLSRILNFFCLKMQVVGSTDSIIQPTKVAKKLDNIIILYNLLEHFEFFKIEKSSVQKLYHPIIQFTIYVIAYN